MTQPLHVHRYGPDAPAQVLALHGLTGHGQRWQLISETYLPEVSVVAPDLLGHGRSSWAAPWTLEANVAALAALLDAEGGAPVVAVGHSFGSAVVMHLAAARPDLVSGLVLLDPAIGLDGAWMAEIADAMMSSPDYPDAAEARAEKQDGSWGDVPPEVLDVEMDEHLIELPSGRKGWRISVPAMMSYWSELARPTVYPPAGTPTTVVKALLTDPPYVDDRLLDGLRSRLGDDLQLVELECLHMVPHAKPAETAAVIRARLGI